MLQLYETQAQLNVTEKYNMISVTEHPINLQGDQQVYKATSKSTRGPANRQDDQ